MVAIKKEILPVKLGSGKALDLIAYRVAGSPLFVHRQVNHAGEQTKYNFWSISHERGCTLSGDGWSSKRKEAVAKVEQVLNLNWDREDLEKIAIEMEHPEHRKYLKAVRILQSITWQPNSRKGMV